MDKGKVLQKDRNDMKESNGNAAAKSKTYNTSNSCHELISRLSTGREEISEPCARSIKMIQAEAQSEKKEHFLKPRA